MDVVVHCRHSVQLFFSGGGGELVVIIEVYCAWVEAIQASIVRVTMGGCRCSMVGNFGKRYPCRPVDLPIMAVDTEVLIECLDFSFAESICLRVVGS